MLASGERRARARNLEAAERAIDLDRLAASPACRLLPRGALRSSAVIDSARFLGPLVSKDAIANQARESITHRIKKCGAVHRRPASDRNETA
jgi:hypothetical protein